MKKIISNSSALISLMNIKRLDLLESLFGKIIIPNSVYLEVFDKKSKPDFIEVKEVQNKLAVSVLNESLGIGESGCIVLFKEIGADLLIMDDLKARKICDLHNIQITGLVGLIKVAYEKKIIKDPSIFINELKNVQFRFSKKLIDDLFGESK